MLEGDDGPFGAQRAPGVVAAAPARVRAGPDPRHPGQVRVLHDQPANDEGHLAAQGVRERGAGAQRRAQPQDPVHVAGREAAHPVPVQCAWALLGRVSLLI